MATEIEEPLKERTRPMQVICLGLCRTGTMSLKAALEKLGYENVYHMCTVNRDPTHRGIWAQAVKDKYDPDKPPLSKAQLDHLLGDYDATTDMPTAIFIQELYAAYPHAKFILTTRPVSAWYTSMLSTIYAIYRDRERSFAVLIGVPGVAYQASLNTAIFENFFLNDFPRFGKRGFKEHNELVRGIVPREQLLEFDSREGWGPLCGFLGREVPAEGYPKANDKEAFRSGFLGWWRWPILVRLVEGGVFAGIVGVGAVVAWRRFGRFFVGGGR